MANEISAKQVNDLLRYVRSLHPGETPRDGDIQLSMLTIALCTGAHNVGADLDTILANIEDHWHQTEHAALRKLDDPTTP